MQMLVPERLTSVFNRVHGISAPVDSGERRKFLEGLVVLIVGGAVAVTLEACGVDPASLERGQASKVERALIDMVEAALNKIVQSGTRMDGQTLIPTITIELPSEIDDHTNTVLSLKVNIEGSEQTIYMIPDLGASGIDNDGQQLVIRLNAHMWLTHDGNLSQINNERLRSQIMAGNDVLSVSKLSPKEVWDKNLPHELKTMVFNPGLKRFDQYRLQPEGQWRFDSEKNEWTRPVLADQGTNLSQ